MNSLKISNKKRTKEVVKKLKLMYPYLNNKDINKIVKIRNFHKNINGFDYFDKEITGDIFRDLEYNCLMSPHHKYTFKISYKHLNEDIKLFKNVEYEFIGCDLTDLTLEYYDKIVFRNCSFKNIVFKNSKIYEDCESYNFGDIKIRDCEFHGFLDIIN